MEDAGVDDWGGAGSGRDEILVLLDVGVSAGVEGAAAAAAVAVYPTFLVLERFLMPCFLTAPVPKTIPEPAGW